jgi:gliding motility-associated-like protein
VTDKLDPAVTIQTPATTICSGMPATFTAAAVNAGNNVAYQWLVNGANAGGNANSFTSSTLADGDIVSCTVTVDPSYTCANHATAASNNIAMTVINQPAPAIMVTASSNDVCAGALVTFTATATNTGANPSYQWMVNNTPANNTSTVFNTTALANGDVVYCVLTPGQGTCATTPVNSNTVAAIINEAPRVIITPADTAVTTGSVVQLNAQVTGSIGSFTWDPAGKLTNPSLLHTATIALTENVTYTLQVTSDKGCTAQAAAIVKVSRPLVMPNAFTPNNDGRNDVFRIPAGVLINVQEFSIFDRWGNRVFTTKDSGKGWDGTFNGKPANAGVYVYVIKGVAFNGAVLKKGEVVLVR